MDSHLYVTNISLVFLIAIFFFLKVDTISTLALQ